MPSGGPSPIGIAAISASRIRRRARALLLPRSGAPEANLRHFLGVGMVWEAGNLVPILYQTFAQTGLCATLRQ